MTTLPRFDAHRDPHAGVEVLRQQLLELQQARGPQLGDPSRGAVAGAVAVLPGRLVGAARGRPPRPPAPTSPRPPPGGPATPGRRARRSRAGPGRGRRSAGRRPGGAGSTAAAASRRRVLVTATRLLPTRWATSSWVSPKSSISCWKPAASSSGVEVLAVEVLDERLLDDGEVVGLADDGRDGVEAGPAAGPPAALAGDELEPPALERAHQDRLEHADLADRRGQLGRACPRRSDDRGWWGLGSMLADRELLEDGRRGLAPRRSG